MAALRALRGIDTVSAIGLVAEIGDFCRFGTARQFMGYEAAWNYRFPARLSQALRERST